MANVLRVEVKFIYVSFQLRFESIHEIPAKADDDIAALAPLQACRLD